MFFYLSASSHIQNHLPDAPLPAMESTGSIQSSTSSPSAGRKRSMDKITSTGADGLQPHEVNVDIPFPLSPKLIVDLSDLRDNVRTTFAWASNVATDLVRKKRSSGELPRTDRHGELAYHAKVMSAVFDKRASWLISSVNTNISSPFDIRKSDFSPEVLVRYLSTMKPPPPPMSGAVEFVRRTSNSIRNGSLTAGTEVMFGAAAIFYKFDKYTNTIDASIQTFQISLKATRFVVKGEPTESHSPSLGIRWGRTLPDVEMIKIEPVFASVQYEFSSKTFEHLKPTIEKYLYDLAAAQVRD